MSVRLCGCLLFLTLFFKIGLDASEGIAQENREIRISNLLPYVVHPPLVEPCLPASFTLGQRDEDPYFTEGYYWGNQTTLQGYFENPESLNGCLIRAQVSINVSQVGLNRFSNDGRINDLSAAGFSEIMVNKGKWGIFPIRDLHAKGPKGRHYYQLWVGLNEKSGATIYFQLLYPEYLSEPTQNQKKIWSDFVKKTTFLKLQDLIIFHSLNQSEEEGEPFSIVIEKRLLDNKFLIHVKQLDEDSYVEIQSIKDCNLVSGVFEKPYLELKLKILDGETVKFDTKRVLYSPVDRFTFHSSFLSPQRLEYHQSHFIFIENL